MAPKRKCRQAMLILSIGCVMLMTLTRLIGIDIYVPQTAVQSAEFQFLSKSANAEKTGCDVGCVTGVPCEYGDEVDLRIIVIVYNRAESLEKCLKHVLELDTFGDKVSVDIWIDRSKAGIIDSATHHVAEEFTKLWKKRGRACVHNQTANAYIGGQWIDTWRPKLGTKELPLILEDDINISPLSYKWLKLVHAKYHRFSKLCGYSLQMENVLFGANRKRHPIRAPKNDTIFLYNMMGTWGFSPAPESWRNFQDWYHKTRSTGRLRPYVPNILPTDWYKHFERKGREEAMWEMWHIYYTYINKEYCIFSNLKEFKGHSNVLLSTNRLEPGLHYRKGLSQDNSKNLLRHWEAAFGLLPDYPVFFEYDASWKRARVS